MSATQMDTGEDIGALDTIRRGMAYSPELTEGIRVTLLLAVLASVGQVVVPVAVQQTLDHGIHGKGGPDVGFTVVMGLMAALAIAVTSFASYLMTTRLFTTSERGLATLRIKAFRHVHDLPLLTQNTERRGALVSRVTSDVDQVSQFLVFGGLLFIVSIGQVLVATVVMVIYSWQLAIVVWVAFAPLFLSLRYFQRKLSAAYASYAARSASCCPRSPSRWSAPRSSARTPWRPAPRPASTPPSTSTSPPAPAPRGSRRSRSPWVACRPGWPTPG